MKTIRFVRKKFLPTFLCVSGKRFPVLNGEQNKTEIFFQEDYRLLGLS